MRFVVFITRCDREKRNYETFSGGNKNSSGIQCVKTLTSSLGPVITLLNIEVKTILYRLKPTLYSFGDETGILSIAEFAECSRTVKTIPQHSRNRKCMIISSFIVLFSTGSLRLTLVTQYQIDLTMIYYTNPISVMQRGGEGSNYKWISFACY